jgi:hypothetical protein
MKKVKSTVSLQQVGISGGSLKFVTMRKSLSCNSLTDMAVASSPVTVPSTSIYNIPAIIYTKATIQNMTQCMLDSPELLFKKEQVQDHVLMDKVKDTIACMMSPPEPPHTPAQHPRLTIVTETQQEISIPLQRLAQNNRRKSITMDNNLS